ncbi:thioredoxin family protein [Bacillus kwashiorkori]|uniref:thioredoxin family protein n=1 Tax=Bacillus kwashiorkori TaxID=1522318 RepID=UPI0007838E93|nr:thioredoxin family protein [Bacillus kwashiorkori]
MQLNDWFQKGISFEQYIEQMERNKEKMLSIYSQFELTDNQVEKLTSLATEEIRVIAITEDWCGDAMLNNPILMRIAERAKMNVHFLLRDQNLELMDQYLTNGTSRAIPIYIFLNGAGEEIAVWGPRSKEMQQFVLEEREKLPPQEAEDFSDKQQEMYRNITKRFLTDKTVWDNVADSIIATLVR